MLNHGFTPGGPRFRKSDMGTFEGLRMALFRVGVSPPVGQCRSSDI
jgi:hypothetical protein